MECKLINPNEPKCEGKVLIRHLDEQENIVVACCPKHFLVYKQIKYLAEAGFTAEVLKQSTTVERLLWISEMEE